MGGKMSEKKLWNEKMETLGREEVLRHPWRRSLKKR
jgi:hypothetical protein